MSDKIGNLDGRFTSGSASLAGKKSRRGKAFDIEIQEMLEQEIPGKAGMTYNQGLFMSLVAQGLKGNSHAVKELWDRGYGRSKQILDLGLSTTQEIILIDPAEKDI